MANEIIARYFTGQTLYAMRFNRTGEVYNLTLSAYETPVNANWADYVITLTESGTTGIYLGTLPDTSTPGGFFAYLQAGVSPDVGDLVIWTGDWDITIFPAGAIEFTYTITSTATGLPIEGAEVWFATDALITNIVWKGDTDAFGVARDVFGNLPLLDAGIYYIAAQRSGYNNFSDTETVSAVITAGSGAMTPISGGTPIVPTVVTSSGEPSTLLSLYRYAQILGLDPLHFWQGISTLRPERGCNDVWYQYDWHDRDKVSRDQIHRLISDAEHDIASAIGYWPAPVWIEDERHEYTLPQRVDLTGTGYSSRGMLKTVQLNRGYVISGGVRATALIDTVSYTTDDADGDGYEEWAIFTIANVTDIPTVCEVKAYFKEYSITDAENTRTDPNSVGADDAWLIRPAYASLEGTTLTVRIPRWLLFKPQLMYGFSVDEIDADDVDSYVDEVSFYRVYNDVSDQVTFGWASDTACESPACAWATQEGCLKVQNDRIGIIIPEPGVYDEDDEEYTADEWSEAEEPHLVWVNYYAGKRPERIVSCEMLDDWWARQIAILATSRLDVKLCTCANISETVDKWREDLALVNRTRSFQNSQDALDNPFGTRAGEVLVWHRLKGRMKRLGRTVKF